MENTDDQDNQTTEANADAVNDSNLTPTDHTNGQVTGELATAQAAVTVAGTEMDLSENPPVTVALPDSRTDHTSSPIPLRMSGLLARRQATNPASPELTTMNGNIDMPDRPEEDDLGVLLEQQRTNTQTPDPTEIIAGEGPLTPRNDAGPFVFDGSAGRSDARSSIVPSVAEVAEGH